MRRARGIAVVVAVAVLIGVVELGRVAEAGPPGPSPLPGKKWPPVAARDIVNVDFEEQVPAGGSVTVYQVPPNRFLVLTLGALWAGNGGDDIQLIERSGGLDELKFRSGGDWFEAAEGIGLVFRPGSEVVALNQTSSDESVQVNLFGYLGPSKRWPPVPPEEIFNAYDAVTLGPGEEFTICEVPPDRWLVLQTAWARFPLREEYQGVQTRKPRQFLSDPQAVGLVFRPGSSIVIANKVTYDQEVAWKLIGYHTRR